ncbi:MAG TPA: saccharopine dehydrogenase C-terminal domain-containing protein [Candidatus Krumholzibacterium sp.]|nr:saccharopine dehydrogenase C-terminal domain-containing protein [Candidatus Krumholzibacterium sp.]
MKVIILGAGLVGGPMALDLASEGRFEVTVADRDEDALSRIRGRSGIGTVTADLSPPGTVRALVSDFDMVISAVPGFMGFDTLREVIEAGRDVIDIAFFPEDPFLLDGLAREKGVTAIMDCGVAPGMSNILAGYACGLLDEPTDVLIYVGGLPLRRKWPWEYRAVFSPLDVIEEYTRPARYVENGVTVVRPALSDPELIDFPQTGTLEAFNSDGLRTLARTLDARNMKEKTMRYPGHIEKIAVLRETGFFSRDEIEIGGARIRPLDFTARILFPVWEMEKDDADLTVMRIVVEGLSGGRQVRHTWDLYDTFDPDTGIHSMARTTGYAATTALRMVADGLYTEKGVSPPEYIGRDEGCVKYMLAGQRERGIVYGNSIEAV